MSNPTETLTTVERLTIERDDLANAAEQARIDSRYVLAGWCERLVFELSLLLDGRTIDRKAVLARFNVIRKAIDAFRPNDNMDAAQTRAVVGTVVDTMMLLMEMA